MKDGFKAIIGKRSFIIIKIKKKHLSVNLIHSGIVTEFNKFIINILQCNGHCINVIIFFVRGEFQPWYTIIGNLFSGSVARSNYGINELFPLFSPPYPRPVPRPLLHNSLRRFPPIESLLISLLSRLRANWLRSVTSRQSSTYSMIFVLLKSVAFSTEILWWRFVKEIFRRKCFSRVIPLHVFFVTFARYKRFKFAARIIKQMN